MSPLLLLPMPENTIVTPLPGDYIVEYRDTPPDATAPRVVLARVQRSGSCASLRASPLPHGDAGPRFEAAAAEMARASSSRALRCSSADAHRYELVWAEDHGDALASPGDDILWTMRNASGRKTSQAVLRRTEDGFQLRTTVNGIAHRALVYRTREIALAEAETLRTQAERRGWVPSSP